MSAINLTYNKNLIYPTLINNTITLKNIIDDKIVYKFPIPKNFQIVGQSLKQGNNRPTYIITPYKLNYPKFVPNGFGNLHLGSEGLWEALKDNGESITYIDTSILSTEDFKYSTLGKFKMPKTGIPIPFWVTSFSSDSFYYIKNISDIQGKVNEFHNDARLITEEELISIFALNDFGFEFWEVLPENIYEDSFMKETEKYMLCANNLCLDNWDIVVASMENRNVYRSIYREKTRMSYEKFWYRNTAVTFNNQEQNRFHTFAVFDNNGKKEKSLKLVR